MPDLTAELRNLVTALEPDDDEAPAPDARERTNTRFLDALRAEWARMMAGHAPAPRARVRTSAPTVRQA